MSNLVCKQTAYSKLLMTLFSVMGLAHLLTYSQVKADHAIRVLTHSMELGGKNNDSLPFHIELWTILSKDLPDYSFVNMPINRVVPSFHSETELCMFPTLLHPRMGTSAGFIQSGIALKLNLRAYTRAGLSLIHSNKDLHDKTVAVPFRGMLETIVDVPYEEIVVPAFANRLNMLLKNRIDVAIAGSPQADIRFKNKVLDGPLYDPAYTIAEIPLTLLCHTGGGREKLIEQFNKNLLKAYIDGKLEAFYTQQKLDYQEFKVDPFINGPFINFKDAFIRHIPGGPDLLNDKTRIEKDKTISMEGSQ